MRTRDSVLEYQKVLDDAGTYSKDLNLVDPISAIELEFEATNGTTSNEDNFLSDVITKIEIVDGSEVLYSVNLSQLEALQFYKTGKTPALFPSEWASGVQRHACTLLFGRHLWDKDFALDLTRFRNPQIKITSNLAAITAVGVTGYVTKTLKATIVAKVMEDLATKPDRYLTAKEIDSFTSAASGEKRIDLPTDYVYRMLMLRAWIEGSDIDEVISNLKIAVDVDKYIPIDRKVKQLDAQAQALLGRGVLKHDIYRANDTVARLLFNKEPDCRLNWTDQALYDIIGIAYQWSSTIKIWLGTHAGAADGTARKLTMVEEGHALHATVPVFFGRSNDIESWFDPKPYKKLEAVVTQATVNGVCSIVAEQVRPSAPAGG